MPKATEKRDKRHFWKSECFLSKQRAFERVFPLKLRQWKGINLLTPNKILQRLPKILSQVYAGNTSDNF